MAREQRIEIIKQIEEKRDSHVITYLTSTRPQAEVQMAMDTIRFFYEHIKIAKDKGKNKIDLFIFSNGGDGTVPWKLVTLIREYCERFSVLIPFRAFSAATLTALGADEIVMHPMGMLGPTDPTVSNDFNPDNPVTKQKVGISVEDVSAYINLIKEDAGITHEDELVKAFNKLAEQVHPLALGNVKRSLSQSRMMARKLLSLHMDKANEQHDINEIIDNLTSKLFYHGHPINRTEAKEQVGIKTIASSNQDIEKLIWDLFVDYEKEMKLNEPFNQVFKFLSIKPDLNVNQSHITDELEEKLVFIESRERSDYNSLKYQIIGTKNPNGTVNTQLSTNFQGWISN